MVEIIPKKPAREIPFKNVIFFVSLVLLITVVLGYVVILRMETKALIALGDLEDGIVKLGTREDRLAEVKVFESEKKIQNFSLLLAGRRKSSNFFDNFASLIHPQVWISEINADTANMKVSISGKSPNFKILEQQLIFLRTQESLVDSFDLSKVAIGKEGGAEFDINFNFKPEIFN